MLKGRSNAYIFKYVDKGCSNFFMAIQVHYTTPTNDRQQNTGLFHPPLFAWY